ARSRIGASTPVMVGRITTPPRGRSVWVTRPSGISSMRDMRLSCEELADDFGGVVDHGDDPRVIETGRTNDAKHADDATLAVAVGGHDGRRTRQREQLVLGPDEDADAFGALGAAQQVKHLTS